jgi:hypothetical protein
MVIYQTIFFEYFENQRVGVYIYFLIKFLFFSLQILWHSQSGDHPLEDLAKYGYKPNMKLQNFNHPFKFLATYWNWI